jgi:hypothetical protein
MSCVADRNVALRLLKRTFSPLSSFPESLPAIYNEIIISALFVVVFMVQLCVFGLFDELW